MINREPRQVRKEAAVAVDSGAGVWLLRPPPSDGLFPIMAYQALARKWRPSTFADVVGQSLVVRALQNAVTMDKVHHAYLFSGTRGVGKTTLARVLARSLCCQQGPTISPCLSCSVCKDISAGCYADLIEVDAASRTRVEDTRDMLDSVPYTPVDGRFKIYLIDEVHMLSQHSFNALLKTLEEPPAHVIFLFATTELHKLPMTIKSRCILCHLRPIDASVMATHLANIAQAESVQASDAALACIASQAKGSLRDALSLLDQAISFTQGDLQVEALNQLFLQSDTEQIAQLLEAVATSDCQRLLALTAAVAEAGLDYQRVVEQLVDAIHSLAVAQLCQTTVDDTLQSLVGKFPDQLLQIFYDMCLKALRDLPTLPDGRLGFEMLLLRLLAFTPAEDHVPAPLSKHQQTAVVEPDLTIVSQPGELEETVSHLPQAASSEWAKIVHSLALPGIAGNVLSNTCLKSRHEQRLTLTISPSFRPLLTSSIRLQITEALRRYWQAPQLNLTISFEDTADKTPFAEQHLRDEQTLIQAKANLDKDACFGKIKSLFDPKIEEKTVHIVKDEL